MPPKGAWMAALHAFNRGSKSWCIRKKGSNDYRSVRILQANAEHRARNGGPIMPIQWGKNRRYRPIAPPKKRKPAKRKTAAEKAAVAARNMRDMDKLLKIQYQRDDDMYAHMLEKGYGSKYGQLEKGWRESGLLGGGAWPGGRERIRPVHVQAQEQAIEAHRADTLVGPGPLFFFGRPG
jgi:hypothetical protein